MELSVIYKNGLFYAHGMEDYFIPDAINQLKKKGWKHNNRDGWFTSSIMSASLLREHANEAAKNIINRSYIHFSPWKGALTVPKGLKLLPHQPGSVRFALSRNRAYLALAPGLGKTIIAALIAKAFGKKVLVVVPPFLCLNTQEEFEKWAPSLHVRILDNVDWIVPDVLIIPDSIISRADVRDYVRMYQPECLIIDEWHRYKERNTQRTRAMTGHTFRGKYMPGICDGRNIRLIVPMSGTPMPNRPIELHTTFNKFAPEYIEFRSYDAYGMKYCGGKPIKNEHTGVVYGNDYTGCNREEFKKLMKSVKAKDVNDPKGFMLRLNKKILGLPLLTEEIVILGDEMPRELKAMNAELLRQYSPKDLMRRMIALAMGHETEAHLHLMTYRRLLGQHKVKPAVEFIKSVLEETDENLLIVGYHKEVMKETYECLSDYNPMIITGDTPMRKRHLIVKEYQQSKKKRALLGNLDAIGVGFTITKADRIPLIEWDWAPGKNRQVIDRVHRIGVDHETTAQYLAFRNSLDRSHLETLIYKESITAYV